MIALGRIHHRDVPDGLLGIGTDRLQHADQALTERARCVVVVEITGERHVDGRAAVRLVLGERELDVELRRLDVEIDSAHGQARELEFGLLHVLHGEHHLDQRMPRGRPRWVEYLDESLERHLRVRERRQIGVARTGEQFGEGSTGIDLGAQHEGVDEHTDDVVECRLTATGDRSTDGDVGFARQPGEQHRESRVQHHEQ